MKITQAFLADRESFYLLPVSLRATAHVHDALIIDGRSENAARYVAACNAFAETLMRADLAIASAILGQQAAVAQRLTLDDARIGREPRCVRLPPLWRKWDGFR